MKFLVGCLIFVAVFSFAKSVASPSDINAAMANTTVAQSVKITNSAIAGIVK